MPPAFAHPPEGPATLSIASLALCSKSHSDTKAVPPYCASMLPLRTATSLIRAISMVVLALLLGLRVLSPAGFMPAFDHGALTIIDCPDASAEAMPLGAMHHHHDAKDHQPCPYASAPSFGAVGTNVAPLIVFIEIAAALLLGRTLAFVERDRSGERPPSRGPPLPA